LAPALFNNKLPIEQRISSRYCDFQHAGQQNPCGDWKTAHVRRSANKSKPIAARNTIIPPQARPRSLWLAQT
jgi:hypothetical protein